MWESQEWLVVPLFFRTANTNLTIVTDGLTSIKNTHIVLE
jgi:hypothetical protein